MIYLKNAIYVDSVSLVFTRCHIRVEEGINGGIEMLDSIDGMPGPGDQVMDCKGKYVLKSFVNAHHHIYSSLARGMPAPPKTPVNFQDILTHIWWRLDKQLSLEMIEASALYTAIESIRNGVSFIIDHHASPFALEGSLDRIGHALEKAGLSHLLCYEVSDRDGEAIAEAGLDETDRYLAKQQGLVGLHASFTIGQRTLTQAVHLARKHQSGIHVHCAEDRIDQAHCIENHNMRVIERFESQGVLALTKSILAHGIHIDTNERQLLKRSDLHLVQNPESNMNNGVGTFTSTGLNESNPVLFGTDGMHSDVLRSMKTAFFMSQLHEGSDMESAYRRLRQSHHYLRRSGFSGDGENNLIVLDYKPPTDFGTENFLGHLIYGIESRHIESLICRGKLVMDRRQILSVDETEVVKLTREMGKKLWEKLG